MFFHHVQEYRFIARAVVRNDLWFVEVHQRYHSVDPVARMEVVHKH